MRARLKGTDMESTQTQTSAETADSAGAAADTESGCGGRRDYCGRGGDHGHHHHRRGGRFLGLLLVALIAGTTGGFIGKSFAHGHGFMGTGAMTMSDPAKRDARIESMAKRFASRVEATPAQRDKLTAIAKDAARDIAPVRDKLRDAHRRALALVQADNVDRAGMEKLRAEQMQLADTVSRRVTQALADAAEVLTPEQRQKIAAKWDRHIGRWEHHATGAFNPVFEFDRGAGRGAVQS